MTSEFQIVQITGLILEEQTQLSLDDLCRACEAQAGRIVDLVDEGVLAAVGSVPEHWRFDGLQLHRARTALRLESDLGVNLAGAALALDLLDELNMLRARIDRLESVGR